MSSLERKDIIIETEERTYILTENPVGMGRVFQLPIPGKDYNLPPHLIADLPDDYKLKEKESVVMEEGGSYFLAPEK